MSQEFFGSGQMPNSSKQWNESVHKFVQPIRYFKSNDPYYWEVDNIPIKQLEENILWLKDQLDTQTDTSGIGRAEFSELKPFAPGDGFSVSVRPGRYSSRINDAYQKGIATLTKSAYSIMDQDIQGKINITISDDILRKVSGDLIANLIANNGLFDHVQHHRTSGELGLSLEWTVDGGSFVQNVEAGIYNLPKNKMALWKQRDTSKNYDPVKVDLQQLSVDFTRRWGGTARTSIVNVSDTLSIAVPQFNEEDYANQSTYIPNTRIDLLFIYSHPVDAQSTTIAKPSGNAPTTITSPRLGLVKGAGAIGLKGAGPNYDGIDMAADGTAFLSTNAYTSNAGNPNNYFKVDDPYDAEGNAQIISPIVDQNQQSIGMENVFGNFPSPDDLMNLAPLLQEDLESTNLALVGQTVLPVAYVVVRKGATKITNSDIIDIRPFFRTTELAYNERAGIAAANPPLSFANPAVGKTELRHNLTKVRTYIDSLQTTVEQTPRVVGTGVVMGGMKYGVEGALIRMAASNETNNSLSNPTSAAARLDWLKANGFVPYNTQSIPLLPEWEVSNWAASKSSAGEYRNDRIWLSQQVPNKPLTFSKDSDLSDVIDPVTIPLSTNTADGNPNSRSGSMHYFVRKRVNINKANVPWMGHFDVMVQYMNCVPSVSDDAYIRHTGVIQNSRWKQYAGIHVAKDSNGFTIYCSFASIDGYAKDERDYGPGNPGFGVGFGDAGRYVTLANGETDDRQKDAFSCFHVTHDLLTYSDGYAHGNQGINAVNDANYTASLHCTYPSVQFTVIGYPAGYAPSVGLGTSNTITLL
jgi:hypothetical protein